VAKRVFVDPQPLAASNNNTLLHSCAKLKYCLRGIPIMRPVYPRLDGWGAAQKAAEYNATWMSDELEFGGLHPLKVLGGGKVAS
jgi:hypothetical protein